MNGPTRNAAFRALSVGVVLLAAAASANACLAGYWRSAWPSSYAQLLYSYGPFGGGDDRNPYESTDPWGRPWQHSEVGSWAPLSLGPDGIKGGGDDIQVSPVVPCDWQSWLWNTDVSWLLTIVLAVCLASHQLPPQAHRTEVSLVLGLTGVALNAAWAALTRSDAAASYAFERSIVWWHGGSCRATWCAVVVMLTGCLRLRRLAEEAGSRGDSRV